MPMTKRAKYLAISTTLALMFLASALIVHANNQNNQKEDEEEEKHEPDKIAEKSKKVEEEWFENQKYLQEELAMEEFRERQDWIKLEKELREKERREQVEAQAEEQRQQELAQAQAEEEQRQQEIATQENVEQPKEEPVVEVVEAEEPKVVDEPEPEPEPEPKRVETQSAEAVPSGQSFTVTSYAIGDGMTPGVVTANGTDVSSTIYSPEGYRIIAVDTNVIPMNTVVTMTLNGQTFKAKASDTGSSINGYKVDLLVATPSEAHSNGVQQATISF